MHCSLRWDDLLLLTHSTPSSNWFQLEIKWSELIFYTKYHISIISYLLRVIGGLEVLVPEGGGMCSSSPPSPSLLLSATASGTFLVLNKYLYMHCTQHITSLSPANKPGCVILMGTPTQYLTLDYQLPTISTRDFMTSLAYVSIQVWYKTHPRSIYVLDPILKHPLLLPPASKCMHVHQSCMDYSEICFVSLSIVYIHNLNNIQAHKWLEMVYTTDSPPYNPSTDPLCTLWGRTLNTHVATRYIYRIYRVTPP